MQTRIFIYAIMPMLADVYEKQGDAVGAAKMLNEAADAAKGTAMESAARRRLSALKEPAK